MAVNENKWGILYCPKNSFRPQKRWENIERVLRSEHIDFDYVQSENMGSVERLVKMMINNGYRTLIIVGGDSALNDAVNCLMQTEKEVRDQIALGVIPNGMMNDFAHFWGFQEGETEKSVKWLKEHRQFWSDSNDHEPASSDPPCRRVENDQLCDFLYPDDIPATGV